MSGPFKNRTNGCHFVWFLNGRDHLKTKFLKLSLWNGFGIQMVGIRVYTVYWLYETINTLLRSTFVCHRRCLSHWRVRSVTSHLSCHTRLSGCVKRCDPNIFCQPVCCQKPFKVLFYAKYLPTNKLTTRTKFQNVILCHFPELGDT